MKKILLVGDGNHQFLRYLVVWLKKFNSDQLIIDILSTTIIIEDSLYDHIYYVENNPKIINKIPKIRSLWFRKQFMRQFKSLYHNYDIVNFHFISSLFLHIAKIKFSTKIILSFWGSDFYRSNKINKRILRKLMYNSNSITVTNPQMKKDINDYYNNFNKHIEIVRFGLEPLEDIKNGKGSKVVSKKALELKDDKIIVCVGYNKSPHQNHIEILRSIESKLTQAEKNNIIIILPLTYSGNSKYLDELNIFLSDYTIKYKTFLKFMTNEEVAALRKATDIFIQLQTTDQFSGSMQEHMYAKNIIITGSWLPYQILEDKNVYFHKIDNVDDIGNKLQWCMMNFDSEQVKVDKNDEIIYQLSAWPNVITDWNRLYDLV